MREVSFYLTYILNSMVGRHTIPLQPKLPG